MMCLKTKGFAAAMALALVAGLAWTGSAWAGTDLANVAFQKTVTAVSTGWGKVFGESNTEDGSITVSGAAARQIITNELPPSWYLNHAYPKTESSGGGGWFMIDLGQEYDISHIEIQPRRTDRWNYVTGSVVQGAADESMLGAFSFTIPTSVGSNDATYIRSVSDWTGVRYIKIESSKTLALSFGELRVFSRVPTWGNFIGDVTATASSTYNRGPGDFYTEDTVRNRASNLVDHTGMTDQGGPTPDNPTNLVGNPDALSRGDVRRGTGIWRSTSGQSTKATVTFDLGGTYNMDQMLIWNYNAVTWSTSTETYSDQTVEGISNALIEYSPNGGVTWIALDDANGEALGNYTIPRAEADWWTDDFGDQFLLGAKDNPYQLAVNMTGITANKVRITARGNHSGGASTYVALSEVRFYGDAFIPEIPNDIPGDANNDGKVDADDAKILAEKWGKSGDAAWADGDFNGDLKVDAKDAAILVANWGYVWSPAAAAEGSVAAVPEPGTAALLLTLLAGVAMAFGRRRFVA